jgi:hypothetical protein
MPELVEIDNAALLVDPATALQECLHSLGLKVLPQIAITQRVVRWERRRPGMQGKTSFPFLSCQPSTPDHLDLGHCSKSQDDQP